LIRRIIGELRARGAEPFPASEDDRYVYFFFQQQRYDDEWSHPSRKTSRGLLARLRELKT